MSVFSSAALATVAALLCGLAVSAASAPAPAITDVDVLNFALNLEYLEASFYSFAAFGHGIDKSLRGGGPSPTGGRKAKLTDKVSSYARELAEDSVNNVKFLRTALGDAAVPIPAIDVGPAFEAAANAALDTTLKPAFDPYANDLFFIHGAFIFEDVGATAYQGAAPLLKSKDLLAAAAGLLSVKSYRAGLIRTLLHQEAETDVKVYNVKVKAIVKAISDLRGSVGGGKDQSVLAADGHANIVPADDNSLTYARTPAEVLAIVTLGGAGGKGGFFPAGLNGKIK